MVYPDVPAGMSERIQCIEMPSEGAFMSLFRCVFKRCIFCPKVEGKFNKNPGVGDILVEIQLIARADNINT